MSVTPSPSRFPSPVLPGTLSPPAASASCDLAPARLFRHCPVPEPFRCSKPTLPCLPSSSHSPPSSTLWPCSEEAALEPAHTFTSRRNPGISTHVHVLRPAPSDSHSTETHAPPGTWPKYLVPGPHSQPTSSPTLTAALAALPPSQTHSLLHRINRRTPSLPPPPTPPAPRDRDTGDGRTPRATRTSTLSEFPNGESLHRIIPSPASLGACPILHVPNVKCQKVRRGPRGLPCEEPAACFILRRPSQSPAPLLC